MAALSRSVAVIGLLTLLTSAGLPQCPPAAWSPVGQLAGVDGQVNAALTVDPDGPGPAPSGLVIGGSFSFAGGTAANRVAYWDGTAFHPLGNGLDNTMVNALCVYNGELIAAGTFANTVGSCVARFNGTSWQALGTTPLWSLVNCLAVYNGDLIAGGSFTFTGAPNPLNIARWNGSTWSPLGSGIGVSNLFIGVSALAIHNGELVAGGSMTSAGGIPANNVARWNGSTWQTLGAGTNGRVAALEVYNGELIAGGDFTSPASRIARWNGSSWAALGLGTDNIVTALKLYNGDIIAGGAFLTAGGVTAYSIARWNGVAWSALGSGLGGNQATVKTLEVVGTDLIAGGTFTSIFPSGSEARSIARWDGLTWRPLTGMNGYVSALTAFNGDLVVGGPFSFFGGVDANRIAKTSGGSWQALGPALNGSVTSLSVHAGQLVATGSFTSDSSGAAPPLNGIAVWNGTAWGSLGTGMNVVGAPWVAEVCEYNGTLIATGTFSTAGGAPANNIAAWNGSSWQTLGSGLTGSISPVITILGGAALTVYNGELIVGGAFLNAGGTPANLIARWNGQTWQPLGSGMVGGAVPIGVSALTVYNGELVAAGRFLTAGGVTVNNIARWNGTVWQPLGTGLASSSLAEAVALTIYGGELIVTGFFTSAGGVPASSIARWNGSAWQSLGAGLTVGPGGLVVGTYAGALFVGGSFQNAGGLVSPYLARWSPPLPFVALSQPSGPGSAVLVTNRWLIPGHEYYNIFSQDASPGGPGTGPYGGLTFNNISLLIQQLSFPVGTVPFHFIAAGTEVAFGPYPLPVGFSIECLTADVTAGFYACLSSVTAYTVQ